MLHTVSSSSSFVDKAGKADNAKVKKSTKLIQEIVKVLEGFANTDCLANKDREIAALKRQLSQAQIDPPARNSSQGPAKKPRLTSKQPSPATSDSFSFNKGLLDLQEVTNRPFSNQAPTSHTKSAVNKWVEKLPLQGSHKTIVVQAL